MGLTKILSSDYTLPGKWQNITGPIQVSSETLHTHLSTIDEDLAEEYSSLEENLLRRMGRGKLYSEEDIREAEKRIEEVF